MRRLALFRRVFLYSRAIREHLSPAGLLVASMTGFAGALGLDTQSNLAHTVFALGAALLAVDAVGAVLIARRLPRLVARRHLPQFVTVGSAARYRLEVGNTGARPLPRLVLAEALRQPWPSTLPAATADRSSNRFDRRVGYPAYLKVLRRLRRVEVESIGCEMLLPGQRREFTMTLTPIARGIAVFENLCLICAGPFGLVTVRRPAVVGGGAADARDAGRRGGADANAVVDTLSVLPARLPVAVPPATSRRLLQPGGVALALRVGESEEFRSLRDYRPGDPLRAIHWRSFARTGKPLVREYQEEFFARHALLLDTAAEAFSPALETAVSLAAGLVVQPREPDSLLDLLFVGDRVHRLTAGRGIGSTDALLRVLATVEATPADSIAALVGCLEQHAAQVASVIAIFLAWDEARQAAIRRLIARGLRPMVLVVDDATTDSDAADGEFAGCLRRVAVTPAGAAT